ncbi:selenocysteine-specific translation elongation factor [Myxococcota bacterium]|nr:selenocysteine-specific translation elongation factor [Myxococcota bacterium]
MSAPTSTRVIVGTAGHIDHGKTTLVLKLTGVDTDRLPEEKKRGITIVLGFAPLVLPNGQRVGLVDVPGHERFVKNMVAGAGGIDVALLVVSADEGVMPQTREHVEICQLLGIRRGVVALTKIDRAERDLVELAADDVRSELQGTFLADAPIVPVSAMTGEGIDVLLATLTKLVEGLEAKRESDAVLLPIDRVFSMKGFGSIITGTLITGSLGVGDVVEVLPPVPGRAAPETVRIRGLQVFHEKVDRAHAGERTAANLAGVELDQLALGQVIVTPGAAVPTKKIAVHLSYLKSRSKPLKTGARILFHTGTALVEAGLTLIGRDRVEPGEQVYAHVLLREPIATLPGQHFIARGFDPVEKAGRTIAGGVILDPHPGRRRRQAPETTEIMAQLHELAIEGRGKGRLEKALVALVKERGPHGLELAELARRLGVLPATCEKAAEKAGKDITRLDQRFVFTQAIEDLSTKLMGIVDAFHAEHEHKLGMAIGELANRAGQGLPMEVVERAVTLLVSRKKIVRDAEGIRRVERAAVGVASGGEARTKVLAVLEAAKLEPPAPEVLESTSGLAAKPFRDLMATMVRTGEVVHAGGGLYFSKDAFEDAKARVLAHLAKEGSLGAPQAKELLGVSRKYLIPLLETLDKQQVTVRIGDVRKAKAPIK